MTYAIDEAGPGHPQPYGWIGLTLSLPAILGGGVSLAASTLVLAFGGGVLVFGWHGAALRVSGLIDAARGDPHAAELLVSSLSILVYAAVGAAVLLAARWRGGAGWRALIGWHPWIGAKRGRLFAAMAALTLGYSVLANIALLHFYPASQEWVKLPYGAASQAIFFFLATVSAPVTEELVFRGWLYTALRAKLSLWPSLAASSLLFALAHWEKTHLYALIVFPVGMALGFLRERTGTLKASVALHALFNGVASVLLYFGN